MLPISTALREAQPESIAELYSRDVEPMSDADIDRIILEQRLHRERMEAAEAAGLRPPRDRSATSLRSIGIRNAPRPDPTGIEDLEI